MEGEGSEGGGERRNGRARSEGRRERSLKRERGEKKMHESFSLKVP